MAGFSRQLPNKPLIEAMLEVHWELVDAPPGKTDPAYPLFMSSLYTKLRSKYPAQIRLENAEIPDQLSPHVVKYQFRRAKDEWPLIQIGPGVATLNCTADYDWQTYRAAAMELYQALNEIYPEFAGEAPRYKLFNLKYINDLPMGDIDPVAFLRDMLHIGINLPGELFKDTTSGPATHLIFSASYPIHPHEGTLGSLNCLVGKKDGVPTLRLELVADARTERAKSATGSFDAWLEDSHDVLEKWFFTLIDGALLEQYRGAEG